MLNKVLQVVNSKTIHRLHSLRFVASKFFQNKPIIKDGAASKFIKKKVEGLLEAKNLIIKYPGSRFNSLNNLNFKIYPGELIAIVGPVGCGKTTLAKSLGRTIEIPDGQLFLDEIDLKTIKLEDQNYASATVYGAASIDTLLPLVISKIEDTKSRIYERKNGVAFKDLHCSLLNE